MARMSGINRIDGMASLVGPSVSCARLRQIQSLLKEDGGAAADGILCTLGIDSRYNEGCSELANYLFFGLYKPNQEPLSEDFPEEMLDDVIILIKAESVHLYCNPVNYSYLLPYFSQWRNLHLHCMTESEYEDEEAAEEFKISSFVSMVEDCSCVGIPYSSRNHVQRFDMFMLEKWPIIQAFALEGIGAGGFFTMKYKLTDVSEQLWQTYNRLDPVSLDFLLNEDLQSFEKQWSCLFSNLSVESALSMQEMSEAQTAEPFRTYYSHGLISSNITDKSKSQQPFALFGSHSCKEDLDNYCFTFPSEAHQVRNTGPRGGAAKHIVLQCVDPKGPLACARTYFFASTHVPYLGNNGNHQQKKTEIQLLTQIYSAAVQSVLAGIKCFSINSSPRKAKDVAEQTFYLALETFGLHHYRNALRSKAVFSIQAVNNEGRVVPLSDGNSRFLVKTATMVVYDIPDLLWGGEDVGSVIFSESFLESSIYIRQRDGAVSLNSCFTVLTSSVPRYSCWLVEESDMRLSEQALQLLKEDNETCLGAPLTTKDSAVVCSSSLLSTPEEGKLVFFSEGLLMVHPNYGAITLCSNHIRSIKVYNGDSVSSVTVLFIEYESSLLPHLPFPLHSADCCLSVSLIPKSKAHKAFYSQVLQAWNKPDSGLQIQLVAQDQLSAEQKSMYSRLLTVCEAESSFTTYHRTCLKTAYPDLLDIDRFLNHFAVSSSNCEESVCMDHFTALFPNTHPKLSTPDLERKEQKVVISIITGLPGSYKDSLCDFLVETSQQCGRLEVYQSDLDSEVLCVTHLQHFLTGCVTRPSETTSSTQRVLLLTPGYTDVLDVIQAVIAHPDPGVQSRVCVGAVTACVNPLTSFMEHRLLFPKLLEQCSQGGVNNVVFTGVTAEQNHPLLKYMQQLIRSANPSAAFILAERGAVTRTEDVQLILSDSSFCQPEMIRARYLLYPGWWEGRFAFGCGSISMAQHCVQFNRSLERSLFLQRCKGTKSSLRGSPFTGNIYHISGKVLFSDSDRLMEVSCNSVSGSVTVVLDQHSTPSSKITHPCYLMFYGVGLTKKALKDWLRQCTKQKVPKKSKKTKKTLTPQEIKNIHVKRHLDPLPPGYFYNGHQFVSFFGEKQNFHPLMDQFVEEYLQEANEEIERFNREVDLHAHLDLFD